MNVSGLEISEQTLRAIHLSRSGNILKIAKFAQVGLPPGTIIGGKLQNPLQFSVLIANFLKSNHFSSSHWIVSLPEAAVYTTYKVFPKLAEDDLAEAVEINLNSLLPGQASQMSWGWQEIAPSKETLDTQVSGKEIMISSMPKEALGDYLESLTKIGLVPIAVEPKSCSIARSFGKTADTLVINLDGGIVTAMVLAGGSVRFARETNLSSGKDEQKKLLSEIRKVMNFYLTENKGAKIEVIILDGSGATPERKEALKKDLQTEVKLASEIFKIAGVSVPSLASLGAGLRTLADPKQDSSLSLLPVGIQKSQEAKRALMFYGGITNIIVITMMLFLILFIGSGAFLKYLNTKAAGQLANLAGVASDTQSSDLGKNVSEINPLLKKEATIESQLTYWSAILKQISSLTGNGVTLTQINYTGSANSLSLVGVAQSRDVLSSFRDSLGSQDFAESVQMPSSNFSESQNISFTINLVIKKDALNKK